MRVGTSGVIQGSNTTWWHSLKLKVVTVTTFVIIDVVWCRDPYSLWQHAPGGALSDNFIIIGCSRGCAWNQKMATVTTLSSLAALEVVTTSRAAGDGNVVTMTNLWFQCCKYDKAKHVNQTFFPKKIIHLMKDGYEFLQSTLWSSSKSQFVVHFPVYLEILHERSKFIKFRR